MSFGAWGKAEKKDVEEMKVKKVKKKVMQKKVKPPKPLEKKATKSFDAKKRK